MKKTEFISYKAEDGKWIVFNGAAQNSIEIDTIDFHDYVKAYHKRTEGKGTDELEAIENLLEKLY